MLRSDIQENNETAEPVKTQPGSPCITTHKRIGDDSKPYSALPTELQNGSAVPVGLEPTTSRLQLEVTVPSALLICNYQNI